jgi:hypothetical protein
MSSVILALSVATPELPRILRISTALSRKRVRHAFRRHDRRDSSTRRGCSEVASRASNLHRTPPKERTIRIRTPRLVHSRTRRGCSGVASEGQNPLAPSQERCSTNPTTTGVIPAVDIAVPELPPVRLNFCRTPREASSLRPGASFVARFSAVSHRALSRSSFSRY